MNRCWWLIILLCCSNLSWAINPFNSDGCSLFPDGTLRQQTLWLSCCEAHDRAYWQGGTYQQRIAADLALQQCVDQVGEPEIAQIMLAGVRVGGSPYWPTSFRWGYGWPFGRGYQPLSAAELELIAARWKDYIASQSDNAVQTSEVVSTPPTSDL